MWWYSNGRDVWQAGNRYFKYLNDTLRVTILDTDELIGTPKASDVLMRKLFIVIFKAKDFVINEPKWKMPKGISIVGLK
jgi:hypothetical protein